ncbi:hypothetical protein [Novosphingobium sp. BL-52-GroH]|uniref:AtuA-related protein n=1 Tax=Novosphingobium sp. BL-52-GroH TaxID=3349877 RepID=UPI00384DADB8
MMKLRELAHVRTGDKGDTSQFSVIAYDPASYPVLRAHVTVERVRHHFAAFAHGPIRRYEMPQLGAFVFVMERALQSGVTRSLSLDPHGKCIGATLLDIEIAPADECFEPIA